MSQAALAAVITFLLLVGTQMRAQASDNDLIPRRVLFGNPAKSSIKISPNGRRLAYLAPSDTGVDNIWIEDIGSGPPRMLTHSRRHGIESFDWAYDEKHILFYSDDDGNEDFHLYAARLDSTTIRDLTPFRGAKCSHIRLSSKRVDEVLAAVNARDAHVYDVYRIDLRAGKAVFDTQNPGDVMSWIADDSLVVRAATAFRASDAATVVRVRDSASAPWRDLMVMPFEDSPILGQVDGGSVIVGFNADGSGLYVGSSLGSDTTRLVEIDVLTGKERQLIATDPESDIWRNQLERHFIILQDPRSHRIQAVPFDYAKPRWKVVDASVAKDFEFLEREHLGILSVDSQDLANRLWTVSYQTDLAPPAHYLYDRSRKQLALISADHRQLEQFKLLPMQVVTIRARDGMQLLSYLTLPAAGAQKKLPMVLFVHGGPWYRDEWGYAPSVQLLANRGYAVLQVQYRGSEGLGKRYLNAGNHQMGLGTDDDLADAVHWAVTQGIADPKRVAVMGYSFGGYHTLRAVTRHPELYACGIDIVGVSDLRTSLEIIPDYWVPVLKRHLLRLGDVLSNPKWNEQLSPLAQVDNLRAPLLVAAGQNDVRVNLKESEQIVSAARNHGVPVTFIVYPDEGHFISRHENQEDLYGRIEEFLHTHLGGAHEPWREIAGSSAELR
jgi:dipeptidyl aminopeptidase/acylaminoacyl peptidase